MSRPPETHPRAQATRRARSDVVRTHLFTVDVDRHRRIDRYIDYFGDGDTRSPDPAGHSWPNENGAP
jgi:hypothetical protein